MTTIRVTCRACDDDAVLDETRITLAVTWHGACTYRFTCPHCDATNVRPAKAGSADLLARGGCHVHHVTRSDELDDRRRRTRRPITEHTIEQACFYLEHDRLFRAALDRLDRTP